MDKLKKCDKKCGCLDGPLKIWSAACDGDWTPGYICFEHGSLVLDAEENPIMADNCIGGPSPNRATLTRLVTALINHVMASNLEPGDLGEMSETEVSDLIGALNRGL